jgi:hypothetical protein
MYLTTESRIGRRWAPPQPLPVGRTSVSAPLHVVLAAGVRRAYWRAEDYFGDFFLCVSRGVRDVGAQQPVFSFAMEGL